MVHEELVRNEILGRLIEIKNEEGTTEECNHTVLKEMLKGKKPVRL